MRLAIEAVDDLARVVERLTRRVEVLEAARQPEDDAGGPGVGGCSRRRGAGPASVQLETEASVTGRGQE